MLTHGLIETFEDHPPSSDSDDFMGRLRLQQVDRDVFTGWCHAGSPLRAFGGQVAIVNGVNGVVAAAVAIGKTQHPSIV